MDQLEDLFFRALNRAQRQARQQDLQSELIVAVASQLRGDAAEFVPSEAVWEPIEQQLEPRFVGLVCTRGTTAFLRARWVGRQVLFIKSSLMP